MIAARSVGLRRRTRWLAYVFVAAGGLAAASGLQPSMLRPVDAPAPAHNGLVNVDAGVAIKGMDPVAYFTEGRPVPGDPAITADYDGAVWRFTSDEHRRAFVGHPSRYEPEYGGFCAYGAAQGLKTDSDPAAFSIIGGRLYLNANEDVRAKWRADLVASIQQADRNWAEVREQSVLVR